VAVALGVQLVKNPFALMVVELFSGQTMGVL
jgi:hypothetical protein